MKLDDLEAVNRAEERAKRIRAADEIKAKHSSAKGFLEYLFSPPAPVETAAARTVRQLKKAREIAAREYNCRPEDVSHEVVASIAQALAINEQTAAAKAANK